VGILTAKSVRERLPGWWSDLEDASYRPPPTGLRSRSRPLPGAEPKPQRLPAGYDKSAGVRQFHGCYAAAEGPLWGPARRGR
jgi:hypothetical protein